jgi:hypothetical protein
MSYRLLDAFQGVFAGRQYRHRSSNRGDWVAYHLYEDLYDLGKSSLFKQRVDSREWVLNTKNKSRGIKARRGDGTFGELVPTVAAVVEPGFTVARGQTANVEIGAEAKFMAKAMIKQIGRVKSDLEKQIKEFHRKGGTPITVAIVGINQAEYCIGYEKDRVWRTDGKTHRHPCQEAAEAERRIVDELDGKFDELLILRYKATNEEPYPFEWVNLIETQRDYAAALTRISRKYDVRFGAGSNSR